MGRRRKMRSQLDAIDQINVTPLLDLTFLLLIVFMITMPLMEYGTNISPPEMNSGRRRSGSSGSAIRKPRFCCGRTGRAPIRM